MYICIVLQMPFQTIFHKYKINEKLTNYVINYDKN